MVSSEKKLANVIGGKTARACDSCIRKRARWYCAADDAFLCQFCDTLVHSANPLARGHERVRLNISSLNVSSLEMQTPTWQQGITKKSRTPCGKNNNKHASHSTPKSQKSCIKLNTLHIVPESESDDLATLDSDERLSYDRVPEYDPFSGDELSFSMEFHDMAAVSTGTHYNKLTNLTSPAETKYDESEDPYHLNSLNGLILPSDLELAEFAADVESLLGKNNLDEESFQLEALGMLDCRLNDSLKVEKEVQLSLDYDLPVACVDEDEKVDGMDSHNIGVVVKNENEKCEVFCNEHVNIHNTLSKKNLKMLKLDYERVIASWDDDRSPWTTGDRPELEPDDCSLDCMGECGKMQHYRCGDTGMMMMGNPSRVDGGREARVSRYREKRRTRLFSKKIRYQVRKVNAEKRPRMKGRFVKRTSFAV